MRTTSLLNMGPFGGASGGRTARWRAATSAKTSAAARAVRRMIAPTLLRLHGRGEIDAARQSRGDEARGERGREGHGERGHDQPQRRVELDGPAERLLVDAVDEDPRQHVAHGRAGEGRGAA